MEEAFLGIDVGTGSARAGVFDRQGRMLAQAQREITTWRPQADFVEQSSNDIWRAVCKCARTAVQASGVSAAAVRGIGFDATCSLVVLDETGQPVSVSPTEVDQQNVIVWMDHRAKAEADEINLGGHDVLKYVGGKISPEMETPKLLWLKRHRADAWRRAAHFFDLPDFLTYRATGDLARSLCSTVCKWTYLGHQTHGWDDSYFREIGLSDLADEGFRRIGTQVLPLGKPLGSGLSAVAADDLGLVQGTAVSVSIIDAHAGGIGMIGAAVDGRAPTLSDFDHRIALIGGTSSCHMAVSSEARFIDGVWGPYASAMVPQLWLNEGGQSATGSLVDMMVGQFGGDGSLAAAAAAAGQNVYEWLNDRLIALATTSGLDGGSLGRLTEGFHVCPYFHGNRSPRANPHLRGMISGLHLGGDLDQQAILYLATIQAIAYGTRHIIQTMNDAGYAIDTIIACGGGTKNPVFLQQHADITGCRVVLPREPEAVLLGAAMLGATAAGTYGTLAEAMAAMSAAGHVIEPVRTEGVYHARKYEVFHQMYADQLRYAQLMHEH